MNPNMQREIVDFLQLQLQRLSRVEKALDEETKLPERGVFSCLDLYELRFLLKLNAPEWNLRGNARNAFTFRRTEKGLDEPVDKPLMTVLEDRTGFVRVEDPRLLAHMQEAYRPQAKFIQNLHLAFGGHGGP
jgi:hypothetical protein